MSSLAHAEKLTDTTQVAYAFDPDEDTGPNHVKKAQRPAKRRKVTKKQPSLKASSRGALNEATFVPLLNGLEGPGFVRLRKKTFTRTWGKIQERIEVCIPVLCQKSVDTDIIGDPERFQCCHAPAGFIVYGSFSVRQVGGLSFT